MRKAKLKKALALALCLIMSLSALTLFASASTTAPTFTTPTDFSSMTTIYVSYANGNDSNDGLTAENAKQNIDVAANALPATGGRILIVDEAKIYGNKAIKVTGNKTVATDTVYIEGMQQSDGSYARLAFGSAGKNIVLTGKTVIYNLEIYGTVAGTHTISADGYDVTIGTNVSLYEKNHEDAVINLIGGIGVSGSAYTNLNSAGGTLTIHSGEWENVSAVSWAFGSDTDSVGYPTTPGTVTVCGGTINNLYTKRSYNRLVNIASATVNYYGGDVTTIIGEYYEGDACVHTVNIYADITTTLDGVFAEGAANAGTINYYNDAKLVAPGTEVTPPPTEEPPTQPVDPVVNPGTAPAFAKTVYMKSTGDNKNDGLSEETPVLTLEKATELLGENGGEIVVLDDIIQDLSGYSDPKAEAGYRIRLAKNLSTIYIHGVKKDDGTYTSLRFGGAKRQSEKQAYGTIIEMRGPIAVYDITLGTECESSVAADSGFNASSGITNSLWISTNAYPFTAGHNVGVKFSYPGTSKGTTGIKICGGQQDNKHSDVLSARTSPIINIYSGVWNDVYAAAFSKSCGQTGTATVNVFGGEIGNLILKRDNSATSECDYVVNYYGGTVDRAYGYAGASATHTVNLMGKTQADVSTSIAFPTVDYDVKDSAGNVTGVIHSVALTINENVQGTAPLFFEAAAYTLEPDTEIDFGDGNQSGNQQTTQTPNDTTTPADTTAPAATTAAPVEEKSGCGSIIGASSLVIIAVMGTAVAFGKKKED